MRVLLTGAHGMVGKNILDCNLSKEYQWLTPSRDELNLLNYDDVFRYIQQHSPDLVIHAAGKVGGISSHNEHQFEYFSENLRMGENVVLGSKNNSVKKLINISSGSIYPDLDNKILCESDLLTAPVNSLTEGYSLAKIAILKLCTYISNEYKDYQYTTVVPSNIFGKWDNFGSDAHMLPSIIKRLDSAKRNKLKNVEIWGDGSAKREFLFAQDFSKFIFDIVKSLDSCQVINLGYGSDFTVLEYNQIIADVVGYKGKFSFNLDKPVGNKRKLLDLKQMKSLNIWRSHSIKEGIKKTYDFYLKYDRRGR